MAEASNTPGWRSTLESVADALDKALGDTDLTHIESDDELRERAPVQWACSQINALLQMPQSHGTTIAPPTRRDVLNEIYQRLHDMKNLQRASAWPHVEGVARAEKMVWDLIQECK